MSEATPKNRVIKWISHDDVIKWKHFPRYWPFVMRGTHRSMVNSPHKGQWRGVLIFSLICSWIYGWVNNGEAGDLRCHRPHYDVIVMWIHYDIDVPRRVERWLAMVISVSASSVDHSHSQTTPSAPSHPLRHPRTGVDPTHLCLLADSFYLSQYWS